MGRRYSFVCEDFDDQTTTTVEFSTENDAWSGYDGPMWKFYDFLKGCGFVFDHETEIGVLSNTGSFTAAQDPFPFELGE